MFDLRQRRQHAPARALWLVFVVLCVLLKPVIGFAGELHRDLHAASHAAHDVPATQVSTTIDGDGDEHAPASGWHAVMHVDLCCGTASLPFMASLAHVVTGASIWLDWPTIGASSAPHADVFRPPIAA